MNKLLVLITFSLTLTSCGIINQMNDSVNASSQSIYDNIDAVNRSTDVIYQNQSIIDSSSRTIAENKQLLEEATR